MTLASEWPSPADILRYYQASLKALDSLKRDALASLGLPPAELDLGPSLSTLHFVSEADVWSEVERLRAELDQEVVLMLVAAFEAALQVDFQKRVTRKHKDKGLWSAAGA